MPGKPAALGEALGLLERTEQAIPPSDVAEIVFVHIQLMMNRVMLGPLDEPTYEFRCADIRMVEVFACSAEERRPCAGFSCTAEHAIDEEACDDRIGRYFERVFVERSEYLDTTGTM